MKTITIVSTLVLLVGLSACTKPVAQNIREVRGEATSCMLGTCATRFATQDAGDFLSWCPDVKLHNFCQTPVHFRSARGKVLTGMLTVVAEDGLTAVVQWDTVTDVNEVPFAGTLKKL